MAIEVFNRFENKYMISDSARKILQSRFDSEMELDAYNKLFETYPICSLYYDTEDNQLIRNSLSSPAYKEKLRLRAYGSPGIGGEAYLEIKKKVRGQVNKRRSAIPLKAAYAFVESGTPPALTPGMNAQVIREIEYLLSQRPLMPKAIIACERRAYFAGGGSDLRISFDTGIITRRNGLRLEYGAYGKQLLPKGQCLMEIKTARGMPVWLSKLLAGLEVYPCGFSKYGAEYQQMLRNGAMGQMYAFIPHPEGSAGRAAFAVGM